jgi:hypothetical protein
MAGTEPTFPSLLAATERVSKEQQDLFFLATAAQLGLLAGAAVTALVPTGRLGNAGPISTLVLFLMALAVQLSGVANRSERRWYAARAAAESIKAASWEFAVGGEAFRVDDETADDRYVGVLRHVLANVPNLNVGALSSQNSSVTSSMKSLRASDRPVRAAAYQRWRVDDQVKWYADKAAFNKLRARQFGIAVAAVEFCAVVFGLLRVNNSIEADYVGIFAACAAGLVGWLQSKKYSNLAEAYAVTSHEVSLVPSTLNPAVPENIWSQAVHDAEAAFSREHTMWQARRQGPV